MSKNTTNYSIKLIASKDTYSVRHPVLREGRPIEDCIFENDDLETTYHVGLYSQNKLVGVVTYMKNNTPLLETKKQYQLRGMAVLKECQGLKYGNALIHYGKNLLKEKGITTIWCNAREIAVPFYEKNGFSIIGKPFNIEKIGLHFTMQKDIQ